MKCPLCETVSNKSILVKEMRLGTREPFKYDLCTNCELLYIDQVPENLNKYYGDEYYTNTKPFNKIGFIKSIAWKIRSFISVYVNYNLIAKSYFNSTLFWANLSNLKYSSKILDTGCGSGDILFEFKKNGFNNLTGIDPNLKCINSESFNMIKGDIFLSNLEKYDLIMFHHSLEHIDNHEGVLNRAKDLLKKNGRLLIRMPILNEAFKKYNENWVQIDAPRHLVIHSEKSFSRLANKLGLEIIHTFYDSTSFQFLGSEQNKNDISFFQSNSYKISKSNSIFTEHDFNKYEKLSKEYNKKKLGDQVGFVLKLVNE